MSTHNSVGMTGTQIREAFEMLGLTQAEAAASLGLSERTLRRYLDEADNVLEEATVPGPVFQAIRGWLLLHENGLPWRPGTTALDCRVTPQSMAQHRIYAMDIGASVRRIEEAGGPALPWEVDLVRGRAVLGAMAFTFSLIDRIGFSPQSYARRDIPGDLKRDWQMLEEGFACVARELKAAGKVAFPPISLSRAQVHSGHILMWDACSRPAFVLKIPCANFRDFVRQGKPEDTPLQLMLREADLNSDHLAKLAQVLLDMNESEPNELGIVEVVASEELLNLYLRRRVRVPINGD